MKKKMKKKMIKNIKFTKASQKDRIKVTVALSELLDFCARLASAPKGQMFHAKMKDERIIPFIVNRSGKTAATNTWPFCQPAVGDPTSELVFGVYLVRAGQDTRLIGDDYRGELS